MQVRLSERCLCKAFGLTAGAFALQNAIRKKNEALNYMRLGSRLDAVVSRLDSQAKMQVCTHVCLSYGTDVSFKGVILSATASECLAWAWMTAAFKWTMPNKEVLFQAVTG